MFIDILIFGDREHRKILKKCDICRHKLSMCIRRVAIITSLKPGITEEDTLCGFGLKLVLSKSKNIDKTNTTKDMRGKAEERLVWKINETRDFIM